MNKIFSWKDICNFFKLRPQVPISIVCTVGIQEINTLKLVVIEYAFHINFCLSLIFVLKILSFVVSQQAA